MFLESKQVLSLFFTLLAKKKLKLFHSHLWYNWFSFCLILLIALSFVPVVTWVNFSSWGWSSVTIFKRKSQQCLCAPFSLLLCYIRGPHMYYCHTPRQDCWVFCPEFSVSSVKIWQVLPWFLRAIFEHPTTLLYYLIDIILTWHIMEKMEVSPDSVSRCASFWRPFSLFTF